MQNGIRHSEIFFHSFPVPGEALPRHGLENQVEYPLRLQRPFVGHSSATIESPSRRRARPHSSFLRKQSLPLRRQGNLAIRSSLPFVVTPAPFVVSLSNRVPLHAVPGGCFAPPSPEPCSLPGGCSAVVSRGIRLLSAPRGSNPPSRNNLQPATLSQRPEQKLESKLRPNPTRNNRGTTSNLFRRSTASPQARKARKKLAKTKRIDSNRHPRWQPRP